MKGNNIMHIGGSITDMYHTSNDGYRIVGKGYAGMPLRIDTNEGSEFCLILGDRSMTGFYDFGKLCESNSEGRLVLKGDGIEFREEDYGGFKLDVDETMLKFKPGDIGTEARIVAAAIEQAMNDIDEKQMTNPIVREAVGKVVKALVELDAAERALLKLYD